MTLVIWKVKFIIDWIIVFFSYLYNSSCDKRGLDKKDGKINDIVIDELKEELKLIKSEKGKKCFKSRLIDWKMKEK